ncbi:MAG: SRPBCC family protein [Acidimicrobiia bacterium]
MSGRRAVRPYSAAVDVRAELDAPCTPEELFGWVDDLADYPSWMRLAHRVDATEPDEELDDGGPAWQVELRARLGPLARSKRLRMVRTRLEPGELVVFERRETDRRRHSSWVLTARTLPSGSGSRLHVHLHYGGGLWTGGVLERALADEIERGRERLIELVSGPTR